MGSPLVIQVDVDLKENSIPAVLGVGIRTDIGIPLLGVSSRTISGSQLGEIRGRTTISCHLDALPLMPGTYMIDLFFGNERCDLDVVYNAIAFEVVPSDVVKVEDLPPKAAGPIYWPAAWEKAYSHSLSLK